MANNCLVTKLNGTVTNDLPEIGSFRIRVSAGKFCIGVANAAYLGHQMTVKANGISQCNHLYSGASEADVVTFPFTPPAEFGSRIHEFYGEAANDFYIDIIDNYNLSYIGTLSRLGVPGYGYSEFTPNYDADWSFIKYRSSIDSVYLYKAKGVKASYFENKNKLYSIHILLTSVDSTDNNFTQAISQPSIETVDFSTSIINPDTDFNILTTNSKLSRLVTADASPTGHFNNFKKESFCNAMANNGRTSGNLRMLLNTGEYDTGNTPCSIYFVPKSEEHPNGWYEMP